MVLRSERLWRSLPDSDGSVVYHNDDLMILDRLCVRSLCNLHDSSAGGVSDKTPLRQNPLYNVKFWMAFNSSERDLSEYICTLCLHRKMS